MSLKKIAKMVGVSPSTVSRVLNNTSSSCASSELKDKIWNAARELQYVPNASAKALKSGISSNEPSYSFYILLGRIEHLEQDPFFYELYRCLENHIFSRHSTIAGTFTLKDPIPTLKQNQGIIILGRCPLEYIQTLKKRTRNIVGIWRNSSDSEIDEIVCDGEKATILAMEYLISLKHKHIAYIGDCSYESRYVGYCKSLMDHRIPFDQRIIFSTDQTQESGFEAMNKLMNLIKENTEHPIATALLCANDITAIGALKSLKNYPKKLRELISVISIDNIDESVSTSPMLTTVHIPRNEMSHIAITILIDRIIGNHSEHLHVEFSPHIIIRDSCH